MKKVLSTAILLAFVFTVFSQQKVKELKLDQGWKLCIGNDMQWADQAFNDSSWKPILTGMVWDVQDNEGYGDYDGFAWYRVKFILSSALRKNNGFNDSLVFLLGKIDDNEQFYLNGKLIGSDGKMLRPGKNDTVPLNKRSSCYDVLRRYVLSAGDSILLWDKENTIAVRVFDGSGCGGIYSRTPVVKMSSLADILSFDLKSSLLEIIGETAIKKIAINNKSVGENFKGKLTVKIQDADSYRVVSEETQPIEIKNNQLNRYSFSFAYNPGIPTVALFAFSDNKTGDEIEDHLDLPFILTPKPGESPRINGAKIFGVRPGKPFLYQVATTGIRPMTFSAKDLPKGLTLDPKTGIITGSVKKAGIYKILLTAKNEKGKITRELRIKVGENLALTPPMGWNSWNCWGLSVSDEKIRQTIDNIVFSGLLEHGWSYINIDDGWEAPKRKLDGSIMSNEKFPDIKLLCDYAHDKGMKLGIYSSPGNYTCGDFLGSYQHEVQDAKTYAGWGIDYLKYDWCSYGLIDNGKTLQGLKKPYQVMRQALDQVNRDIVFSICQYGMGNVWKWGGEVGGNLWRTGADITDSWESILGFGFSQTRSAQWSKPGNWSDPDMLVVGWVGWGPSLHPARVMVNEQYTHISLWCLLAAPLLLGNDLSRLDAFTLSLITNDEVIEVDQDPLGKAAQPVVTKEGYQVWVRDLEDGSKAVGLFNFTDTNKKIKIDWSTIKVEGNQSVRDLWRQKDIGTFDKQFEANVYPHGTVLVKIKPVKF